MELTRQQRLEHAKADLAVRIRPVCDGMADGEFERLIDDMARFRLKHEDRQADLAKAVAPGDRPRAG